MEREKEYRSVEFWVNFTRYCLQALILNPVLHQPHKTSGHLS